MIKNIKLFINNNDKSVQIGKLVKDKFVQNGFIITDENFDLGIAVGGDGAFLRMIKNSNFNSNICYVGINSGTLGFLQEVKVDEIDKFIKQLKNDDYKVEDIGIQETTINHGNSSSKFYSLNEIVVRDRNLKTLKLDIKIDGDLLEKFIGEGILVASSTGSTAQNLSYGGSIVYNTFSSLQITPIAPINSKVYRSLLNSVIIPDKKVIEIVPDLSISDRELIVTVDGENNFYKDISDITTKIDSKKIKCLRLKNYNFPQKINEKLLTD